MSQVAKRGVLKASFSGERWPKIELSEEEQDVCKKAKKYEHVELRDFIEFLSGIDFFWHCSFWKDNPHLV